MHVSPEPPVSYLLPIKRAAYRADAELDAYLTHLAAGADVVVVDGSPADVFAQHAAAWGQLVTHVPVAADLSAPNGKVAGVLTGLRHVRHEAVIIADDDVRYDDAAIAAVVHALGDADVVRPQNYYAPLPWHALWDTGRILLNRATGGDWPGTLAVRRSALAATKGYAGDVLFENLELVRTIAAAGGRVVRADDILVRRIPTTSPHFWSQRVRQAYDEIAGRAGSRCSLPSCPVCSCCSPRRRCAWCPSPSPSSLWALPNADVACVADVRSFRSPHQRSLHCGPASAPSPHGSQWAHVSFVEECPTQAPFSHARPRNEGRRRARWRAVRHRARTR